LENKGDAVRVRNICEYGGGAGILITLTCLVQHFIFAIPNSLTNPFIFVYLFAVIAFILLAMQKPLALLLLIISALLCFYVQYQYIHYLSFSLIVSVLLLYHIIVIITLFVEEIPSRIRKQRQIVKKEEDYWKDKI
jgi:hypothetical protein